MLKESARNVDCSRHVCVKRTEFPSFLQFRIKLLSFNTNLLEQNENRRGLTQLYINYRHFLSLSLTLRNENESCSIKIVVFQHRAFIHNATKFFIAFCGFALFPSIILFCSQSHFYAKSLKTWDNSRYKVFIFSVLYFDIDFETPYSDPVYVASCYWPRWQLLIFLFLIFWATFSSMFTVSYV